jgi:hypothetical protein
VAAFAALGLLAIAVAIGALDELESWKGAPRRRRS